MVGVERTTGCLSMRVSGSRGVPRRAAIFCRTGTLEVGLDPVPALVAGVWVRLFNALCRDPDFEYVLINVEPSVQVTMARHLQGSR